MPKHRQDHLLLCVDDEKVALSGWCLYLQGRGYKVVSAASGEEGLHVFAVQPVSAVILDYAMPEVDGSSVAAIMKRLKPEVPILLFTGVAEVPEELREHIDAHMEKGCAPKDLVQRVDELLGVEGLASEFAA